MNILLYVAGFLLCFSSFGMTDGFKIREEASRIANLMNEKKFTEAQNSLERHLSYKTLDFNAVLDNCKESHTLLSYYIYFVKDKMNLVEPKDEYCVGHLGYLLLSGSKDQFEEGQRYKPHYYLQKNDKRIREMIISLFANKRFKWAEGFLAKGSDICCLDYNETFMYNLGDALKEYTFCSFYISVLKYKMNYSAADPTSLVVPSIFIKSWSCQLRGVQYEKDCYIKKNDPRIIDIGLYILDSDRVCIADEFLSSCDRYVDLYDIMQCKDISHAVISFYYKYCVDQKPNDKYSRFRNRARDELSQANLTRTYKTKMLEMISYLKEKEYHMLARLFLKKYFSNEDLYELGIEYDILSFCQCIFNRSAPDNFTSTKMLEMISYLKEKEYHMLDRMFYREYFSNKRLQTPGIGYNILSCYQYVLNQMDIKKTESLLALGGLHSTDKPQVAPQFAQKDLQDIMIFLGEKKCHIITNALFSEYGPNKILDAANTVFKYDVGGCEKACTPVALSVLYTLTELAERNKVDEFGKECEDLKKYLLDNGLISKSVLILNKCIANTQGSKQQSLISLKKNIKLSDLAYRYFLHLYKEILQFRKKIKQQIDNEYVTCVEIMKWILHYQA